MRTFFYQIAVTTLLVIFIGSCSADKCKNVTCQNGGTCSDGNCNCPAGWGGAACQTPQAPVSMAITQITADQFAPVGPGNNPWASGNPGAQSETTVANIYPVVTDSSGHVLYSFSANPVITGLCQETYNFT